MKPLLIILISLYTLTTFGQQLEYPDSGFTNKAEAKNLMVNGLKEGKWVVYYDAEWNIITDTNAPYYILTVYKSGKAFGIERAYYKSGGLYFEISYFDGKKNGIEKVYYENGKLWKEAPFTNGDENGKEIWYSKNGLLIRKIQFYNGKEGESTIIDY